MTTTHFDRVDASTVRDWLKRPDSVTVLDVRSSVEFETARIPSPDAHRSPSSAGRAEPVRNSAREMGGRPVRAATSLVVRSRAPLRK